MDQSYSIRFHPISETWLELAIDFKKELDKFLGTVPGEPLTTGYTARRRAESNSLLHMIPACKVWTFLGSVTRIMCFDGVPQFHVGNYSQGFFK